MTGFVVLAAATVASEPRALLRLCSLRSYRLVWGLLRTRLRNKPGFLRKYFLGNRSLGAFAVALTAAVMSGGTFVGFPSLVYTYGWVVGLWIASYMVAPLTVLGILGKRIGQISRKTGAITLPDFFRERFKSPALGLVTSLFVMFFLCCFLIAQFRAGGVIMKKVLPEQAYEWAFAANANIEIDKGYLAGLLIFSATVVAYTAYGGFLAAVWTDVFQSIVMAIGVMILLPLAIERSGGLAHATYAGMKQTGPGFAFGPGAGRDFHPLSLAFSYFVMWAITGMGQPSTLVRLMAFRDSKTLRYSMIYLTFYNFIIYVPLVLIFVMARSILPDLKTPDEAMPSLVITLANPYLAGLIMAAPYGAVMSTVSGFLLIVSSGLVRDVYQRFLRPAASERELAFASYAATIAVGVLVALLAMRKLEFLQLIIVFSSAGMASAFLVPALFAAFWRRATAQGAMAACLVGAGTMLLLYGIGMLPQDSPIVRLLPPNPEIGAPSASFRPYYLMGFDPCVWGLLASLIAGVVVSLLSPKPDPRWVTFFFDAEPLEKPNQQNSGAEIS